MTFARSEPRRYESLCAGQWSISAGRTPARGRRSSPWRENSCTNELGGRNVQTGARPPDRGALRVRVRALPSTSVLRAADGRGRLCGAGTSRLRPHLPTRRRLPYIHRQSPARRLRCVATQRPILSTRPPSRSSRGPRPLESGHPRTFLTILPGPATSDPPTARQFRLRCAPVAHEGVDRFGAPG